MSNNIQSEPVRPRKHEIKTEESILTANWQQDSATAIERRRQLNGWGHQGHAGFDQTLRPTNYNYG